MVKKNKKITLHAIGNQDNFNFYEFDKKQEVMEILAPLLFKFFDYDLLDEYFDGKKKINIEKFKDVHHGDFSKNRVDIFYGDKKMFITIHCSEKLRLKFNEELGALVKMPKPKKIKTKKKK